jgi:hypothetical protein
VTWGAILRTRKKKKTGEFFREDREGRTLLTEGTKNRGRRNREK